MQRDIVVIGGSAGALEPLRRIASELPPDLPAAVVVCLHIAATAKSALTAILNRSGALQAVRPRSGDPVTPGYIYVATPGHHIAVDGSGFRITTGPRVNGSRPAVDVLFRSAAAAFGPRVVGVVLSGGLDDGSNGLVAIRAAGGVGIAQSPDDALIDSMPRNAIEVAEPEHVLKSDQIGATIARIVLELQKPQELAAAASGPAEEIKGGVEMEVVGARDTPGQVTGITCPDCHGSIWLQLGQGGQVTYACRIGHSYSPESMFEVQAENVENALWAGVRSLEEQAALAASLASRATKLGDAQAADGYEIRRQGAEENAETLRSLLLDRADDVA